MGQAGGESTGTGGVVRESICAIVTEGRISLHLWDRERIDLRHCDRERGDLHSWDRERIDLRLCDREN